MTVRQRNAYALEHEREFERLEKQSTMPAYDYRKELAHLNVPRNGAILDAGCGSGVVSRYLAQRFPSCRVVGCDIGVNRIEQARKAGSELSNLSFQVENLTSLDFESETFDSVICRYVLHHFPKAMQEPALRELLRITKRGGTLVLIEYDGPFLNIFPQTPLVAKGLKQLQESPNIDLNIARKLPSMVSSFGECRVSYEAEIQPFQGGMLADEISLIEERFVGAEKFLSELLGSSEAGRVFKEEYLELLRKPGTVLFYNKFIVSAVKGAPLLHALK